MRNDVQSIFRATPSHKQVMMFSATLSKEIRVICKKFMQNPLEIYVDDEKKLTLHGLQQYYMKLDEREKNRKLNDLLDSLEFNQVIIFVRSTLRCTELDKLLRECNFPSTAVHSGIGQEERYVVAASHRRQHQANMSIVSSATRSSRSSRLVSVSPLIFSVVVLTLSVSMLPSTTICPTRPTPTFTVSVVQDVSEPRVSVSRLSAARMTRLCSNLSRRGSRFPFQSSPRMASTLPPTWTTRVGTMVFETLSWSSYAQKSLLLRRQNEHGAGGTWLDTNL